MISIYHNPRCSKSREALEILEKQNAAYKVIKYLDKSITEDELKTILTLLKIKPIELVRTNESLWKDRFKNLVFNDVELITIMLENPKLIERPIIINGNRAVIGRPPKRIFEIL